jgi:hypothetical protein
MLKLPSTILEKAGASTRRQYASIVFKCLQQTSSDTNDILSACFENEKDVPMYVQHIQEKVDLTFPCENKEECVVLPPLFLRSKENFIGESSQLLLVAYDTGPIFPVVRVRNAEQIIGDKSLLDSLYRVYEALSSERATRDTIDKILGDANNS